MLELAKKMMGTGVLKRSIATIGIACVLSCIAGAASAQSPLVPSAPFEAVDQFGVELSSGMVQISSPTISVGPADGGLSFTATWDTAVKAWRYSDWGAVNKPVGSDPNCYNYLDVVFLGKTSKFQRDTCTGLYERMDGLGTLTETSGVWTYTAPDGTVGTYQGLPARVTVGGVLVDQNRITSIAKPNGEVMTFTYTGNLLQSVTNNLGYQTHFDYVSGVLSKVTTLNNAVDGCAPSASSCTYSTAWPSLDFTAGASGPQVTDGLGRTTRIIIDTNDRIVGMARPTRTTGASVTYTQGFVYLYGWRVVAASDGVGTWTYAYEPWPCGPYPGICPRPTTPYDTDTTVTDPNGGQTVYNFNWEYREFSNDQYRLETRSVTNALGQITPVIIDGSGLVSAGSPEGNGVQITRDPDTSVVTAVTEVAKTGSGLPDAVVAYSYPACTSNPVVCRRPLSMTDARGAVTDYTYDAAGNVLTATRPATAPGPRPQTRYAYQSLYAWYRDASGSIVQAATPVWRLSGTSACTTSAPCTGQAQEVVTAMTYPTGSASTASNLLPTQMSSGAGDGSLTATTLTTYDPNGDPLIVQGPLGSADTTRNVYDVMRQQVGVISPDPDGAASRPFPATRTAYNADGQAISVQRGTTPGQSNSDWAAFNALQTSTAVYDQQARKIRDTAFAGSPDAMVTQYSYDAEGRPTCTAQRMNPATFAALPTSACTAATTGGFGPDRIAFNEYDAADRLIRTTDGYGTSLARSVLTQTWTPNSKVDWIEDAQGNRSDYVYDGFDRLKQLFYPQPTVGAHAANPSDYQQYGYDANDNPTTRRTRNYQTFTTAFDALNRPTSITAPANVGDTAYTYDLLDRRLTATLSSTSAVVTTAWDALGRMTSETGPLGTFQMAYDLDGRRTRMDWPGSPAFFVTYDWNLDDQMKAIRLSGGSEIAGFQYDNLGRRTLLSRGNGVPTTYAYDGASRLISQTENLAGSTYDQTWAFTYNPAGQVVTRSSSNSLYSFSPPSGAVTYPVNGLNQGGDNGLMLPYDLKGNLLGDPVLEYTYDQANKLRTVRPTGSGSPTGTLTYDALDRLSVLTGTQGATYAYAGSDEIAALANTGSALNNRYVRGPNADELLVSYAGTSGTPGPVWWINDPQGSAVAIAQYDGTTGSIWTYDEYGQRGPNNGLRIQYTGQLWLPDFQVYHYKARAYAPRLGRFLQTDPVGYDAGLNLYGYVEADPVNRTDPLGLFDVFPNGAVGYNAVGSLEPAAQSRTPPRSMRPRGMGPGSSPSYREIALEVAVRRIRRIDPDYNFPTFNGSVSQDSVNRVTRLADSMERADSYFQSRGIGVTGHGVRRIAERSENRSTTNANVLSAYNSGRPFWDPANRNYVRYDSRTGVSVSLSSLQNGTIITVYEGRPSPRWNPIPYR